MVKSLSLWCFALTLLLPLTACSPSGKPDKPAITDGAAKPAKADLPETSSLDLTHTPITDEGLKSLIALKQLKTLDLSDTKITDAGVKSLVAIPGLEWLFLGQTGLTDAGLKELCNGKDSKIELLYVGKTTITDDGLKALPKLAELRQLELSGNPITDAGMKEGLARRERSCGGLLRNPARRRSANRAATVYRSGVRRFIGALDCFVFPLPWRANPAKRKKNNQSADESPFTLKIADPTPE